MKSRTVQSLFALALIAAPAPAAARVIVQYFETPWAEIASRMPELIAIGYDALWLPPPQKGADGASDVGFAVFDRFDLGDVDQRGSVRTRYGNRAELVAMADATHRGGLRLLFDVVMNHNANPSLTESAGLDLDPAGIADYPDTVPADYHVLPARPIGDGAWEALRPDGLGGGVLTVRPFTEENPEAFVAAVPMPDELAAAFPGWTDLIRAPRIVFDGDLSTFENQTYSLLGLIDFALDPSGTHATLGIPLPRLVRQPDCPDCYPDGVPVEEDAIEYVIRAVLWLGDVTGADGFRLDAVRHAPTQFFDRYNQAIQDWYDAGRGNSDADDRDLRGDAQLFGESFTGDIFGELSAYHDTGMQMLNFPLFFTLDGLLSAGAGGGGDLGQLSFPQGGMAGGLHEFGGLGRVAGVSFVQSHDSPAPSGQPNLGYAFILTRVGDAVVFFDGNNPDPRSFVKPGRPDALGDLGSRVITDLIYVHNHFARGGMFNRFVDADAYAYERAAGEGGGQATLLVVLHDQLGGEARFGEFDPRPLVVTAFPPGTVLRDYSGNSPVAQTTVLDPAEVPAAARDRALAEYDRSSDFAPPAGYGLVHVAVPPGPDRGYALYAPLTPAGPASGERPLTVWQAGQRVADVTVQTVGERRTAAGTRVAARDLSVARVTGREITIKLRTDDSAERVYLRLDAGGAALAGEPAATGTPEGAFDGFVEMRAAGSAGGGELWWELGPIDASALADGMHSATARALRIRGSAPIVWSTFAVALLVDREPGGDGPIWEPLDRDGDGVASADDNCASTWNPTQADFDGDRVGDPCDACPDSGPAALIDADGCVPLGADDAAQVQAAVDEVLAGQRDLIGLIELIDEVRR